MQKMGKLAGIAVGAVLALSGCASAGASADEAVESVPAVEASAEATAAPSAPVVVEPEPVASAARAGLVENGEELFTDAMHSDGALLGMDGVPDADLLAAGWYACELFAQGQPYDTMDVVQGDDAEPGRNDRNIAAIASQVLCSQYMVD